MPEPLAYLNGQLIPQGQLAIPFCDAGFIYGATATDLARTFHFRPFRLADHLTRFRQSCGLAEIPLNVADEELDRIANHLVACNSGLLLPGQDLAVVMFATPGPVGHYAGLEPGGDSGPTLGMHTFPLPFARYARFLREGVRLVVPSVRQVPRDCVDPRIKQRSRMHWWLAEQEAHRAAPGSMALLLDEDGFVTETASSNLAIVSDGVVLTPPRTGVLAGVSLQVVKELCGELGLRFEERPLTVQDCLHCEEAFVTCTTFCLAAVSAVNGVSIPFPGPTCLRLVEAWNRRVGLDVHQQILSTGQ